MKAKLSRLEALSSLAVVLLAIFVLVVYEAPIQGQVYISTSTNKCDHKIEFVGPEEIERSCTGMDGVSLSPVWIP